MLELKFAIYYRAASLPSQASYAVLTEESISLTRPGFLQTLPPPTVFLVQQSYVIITFRCQVICVHVYMWRKKWRRKGSHSYSVSGLNRLM